MWLRIILIGILIWLLVSMISRFLSGGQKKDDNNKPSGGGAGKKRGFPDDMGEYVDYEEVDDD